jgi:competence protein ComEC
MLRASGTIPHHLLARRRALAALLAWSLGTFAAASLPDPPDALWCWAAAAAFALAAAFLRRPWTHPALAASLALLATGWYTARIRNPDPIALNTLAAPAVADAQSRGLPTLLTLRATILTPPRDAPPPEGFLARFAPASSARTRVLARVHALDTPDGLVETRGTLAVWIGGDSPVTLQPGDPVILTGRYVPPAAAQNPGQPDRLAHARQAGRVGTLNLTDASLVTHAAHTTTIDRARAASLRTLWALRARASDALDAATPLVTTRALVKALVLGEPDPTPDPALGDASAMFSRLGVVHILSISGFHVSAMALFVAFLVRLPGERGRWQTALLALPIAAYLLIVPAEAPVLRAGILALVILISELAARRYDPATLLLWTCLALLVWRPLDLWSLGFQLSGGMTLALLWVGPIANDRLWGSRLIVPGTWRRVTFFSLLLGLFKSSVGMSLLCWSLSAPFVAWRTGMVSPLAVAASVLLAPIFAPLLYLAFAALLVGLMIPPAAAVFAWLLTLFTDAALTLAASLDHIPGSSFLAPPIPFAAAALATACILWCWVKGRVRDLRTWAAASLALLALAVGVIRSTWLPRDLALRFDTLAVVDGTCHVLRAPRGNSLGPGDAILWDCGSLRPGLGVREIPAALRALGLWRIPSAVVSHADFDHYAALPDIAHVIGLRRVLLGERFLARAAADPAGPAAAFLDFCRTRSIDLIPIAAGHVEPLGHLHLTFLSPPPEAHWQAENDHSLVAAIAGPTPRSPAFRTPPSSLALLTGDIQSGAIAHLRDTHPDLRATIVEAPHHGSNRPDAAAWVATLAPRVVLQSTGPQRASSPNASVWDAVKRDAAWFTTSDLGAIRTDLFTDGRVLTTPLAPATSR